MESEKIKIILQFQRVSIYEAITEVTLEEFENMKKLDDDDVSIVDYSQSDEYNQHPIHSLIYEKLDELAVDENAISNTEDFNHVFVSTIS